MLQSSHRSVGAIDIYNLQGSFNSSDAAAFREKIVDGIANGRNLIVLNFKNIDFIDSQGLGFLVSILKSTKSSGGEVRIASLGMSIREIFEMTKLDRVFSLDENESISLENIRRESWS